MGVAYDESYFEGFEAGYKLDAYKAWYHAVIQRSIVTRGRRFRAFLDIGCAYGYFMMGLNQRICTSLIVGIDVSIYAAKQAKKLTRSEIIVASALALPFREETFDLVTALELVEHLTDIPKHLVEIYRVLTSCGIYFASTLNRLGTARLLETLGLLQANPTHIKLYTSGKLREQLRAVGFRHPLVSEVQMGLPLPNGRFIPLSFPAPFGSSIFVNAQK